MKVTANRQDVLNALALAARVANATSTLPIYSAVQIETAAGDTLRISATDSELCVATVIDREPGAEDGVCVVDAAKMHAIVRGMPDTSIVLIGSKRELHIVGTGAKFVLSAFDAGDFPVVPEPSGERAATVAPSELARVLNQTSWAAAAESSRYAINGVLLNVRDLHVCGVATDGRRLARSRCRLADGGAAPSTASGILPIKAVRVLARMLAACDPEAVGLDISTTHAVFYAGRVMLRTVLCEGSFPDYSKIVPETYKSTAVVGRCELSDAISRASVIAQRDDVPLNISFDAGVCSFVAASSASGDSARIEISAAVESTGGVGFSVNPQYVSQAVNAAVDDKVRIGMSGSELQPVAICGEDDTSYLCVIMPIAK